MAVNAQAGLILLGILQPAADAGRYSIALKAATTVSILLLTVSYPAGPVIARLYARKEYRRVQRVVSQSAHAVAALTFPLALGMFVFAGPILHIFFGAQFASASVLLRIMAAGEVVNVVTGLSGLVLLMTGHEREWGRGVAAGAAATLLLALALIPLYAATGAAIATAGGVIVSNILLTIYAWRRVRINSLAVTPRWLRAALFEG
jgi:O-antigen/teichoic acid export membrane protein